MALTPKRRPKQIFEKVDTNDKRFISTDKETAASASFVLGEHIRDNAVFEVTKPILFQLKLIEEDIDEIRRFATGSGEINVNGGSF